MDTIGSRDRRGHFQPGDREYCPFRRWPRLAVRRFCFLLRVDKLAFCPAEAYQEVTIWVLQGGERDSTHSCTPPSRAPDTFSSEPVGYSSIRNASSPRAQR